MAVEHGESDDCGWFVTLADDGRVIGDCGTRAADDGDRSRSATASRLRSAAAATAPRPCGLADWVAAQPEVSAVVADVEVGRGVADCSSGSASLW